MKNTPSSQYESLEQDQAKYLESWISFYAKKNNLHITIDPNLPAPAAVPDTTTGATPTIIINPKLCIQEMNLTNQEFLQVIFHEIEHLKEDAKMISTDAGKKIAQQRQQRQKEHKNMASSYHFLENILRDVYVNKQVIDIQNIPVLKQTLHDLYQNKLFSTTDYTKERKHKQFGYAIVREAFVPEEQCVIDPQIRKIITRFHKSGILERATTGPMEDRLKTMWELIEPTYKKLLEQDEEKHKEDKKNKEQENQEKSDPKQGDPENQDQPESGGEPNPFDDEYEDVPKHILEDALKPEDMEKFKKQLESQEKGQSTKTAEQAELEHKAKRMLEQSGENPEDSNALKKAMKNLSEYQKEVDKLEEIKDKETGESVIDEIVGIFEKIKSQRFKMKYFSKSPVDLEHGTRLFGSVVATGIADFYGGNANPEMFEMDARREKINEGIGTFQITILADGTGSMQGERNIQQKKAILLVFEALKRLHDKLEINREYLTKPLEFQTEGYIFGTKSRKIKDLGNDFTNNERISVYNALNEDDGSDNNEGLLLKKMYEQYLQTNEEEKSSIKQEKIRKLIFVFTDGGQDGYEDELVDAIQKWRSEGVLIYGIGIGKDADLSRYTTDDSKQGGAEYCKDPSELAQVMKKLLTHIIK